MPVPADLYNALSAIPSLDLVCDTKAPDGYSLPLNGNPLVVYLLISDVPLGTIRGQITAYQQRWQVDIRALDLTALRTARKNVIGALHGLTTSSIQRCDLEGPAPVQFEDGTPAEYHCPIDFLIQTTGPNPF